MDMLEKLLNERNIAPLSIFRRQNCAKAVADIQNRRAEILQGLEKEIYGRMPEKPEHLSVETISEDRCFAAGFTVHRVIKISAHFGNEIFSFLLNEVVPKSSTPLPAFVHIDTSGATPSRFTPHEEISDGGFAVFSFCAFDVATNDGNFRSGISKHFGTRRSPSAPGKLITWAWAAMRAMDYIQTLEFIDKDRVAVIGHENLGKSALLAGAYDERFTHVIASSSGVLGASLISKNKGKPLLAIIDSEPYLFNPSFVRKMKKPGYHPPKDQHQLLAAIAPRYLIIGSAIGDYNGDVESDFLSAVAASESYKSLGIEGLCHSGKIPTLPTLLDKGRIIHYVRDGVAYLSRRDWQVYMSILKGE